MLEFLTNELVQVVVLSFIIAQAIKVVSYSIKLKTFYLRGFFESGGLPSGHSAVVASLTAMIYFSEGLSNLFFVSLFFSLIIMYDAVGVRRETGKQARVLLALVKRFKIKSPGLKQFVGHNLLEVLLGAVVGIFVAIIFAL
jgi:acid phosphatase family membrane protein YuiD